MGLADACTYGRPCRCSECCMCMECFFPMNVSLKVVGPRGGTRLLQRYACLCRKLEHKVYFKPVPVDDLIDDEMCKFCNTKMKSTKIGVSYDGKYTTFQFNCENEHNHLQIMSERHVVNYEIGEDGGIYFF